MITLLSLDTSLTSTGYCIFRNGKYATSGTIKSPSVLKGSDKVNYIISELNKLIKDNNADIVCIEELHVNRNFKVVVSLAQLIGAVRGYCVEHNIFFYSIAPTSWRKQVGMKSRKREEQKAESIKMVKSKYGLDVDSDDQSDAILIAIAYCKLFDK